MFFFSKITNKFNKHYWIAEIERIGSVQDRT